MFAEIQVVQEISAINVPMTVLPATLQHVSPANHSEHSTIQLQDASL